MKPTQLEDKKIPMTCMKAGQKGFVASLDTTDKGILKKLMSMGVLPGISIEMIQRYPSYVFQAGFTCVAVDTEIASVIMIHMP